MSKKKTRRQYPNIDQNFKENKKTDLYLTFSVYILFLLKP